MPGCRTKLGNLWNLSNTAIRAGIELIPLFVLEGVGQIYHRAQIYLGYVEVRGRAIYVNHRATSQILGCLVLLAEHRQFRRLITFLVERMVWAPQVFQLGLPPISVG